MSRDHLLRVSIFPLQYSLSVLSYDCWIGDCLRDVRERLSELIKALAASDDQSLVAATSAMSTELTHIMLPAYSPMSVAYGHALCYTPHYGQVRRPYHHPRSPLSSLSSVVATPRCVGWTRRIAPAAFGHCMNALRYPCASACRGGPQHFHLVPGTLPSY